MELQVAIQYIWQHIKIAGLESESIAEVLEKTAIAEMKHYEKVASRIDYFGGNPTTKPAEIKFGKTTKEMLEIDKAAEEDAIRVYKDIIKVAVDEGDNTTRVLIDGILKDEEDHHYKFKTLLGQ